VAMERSNPLPPNARYWVDVAPEDQPAFSQWLAAYRGAVQVVSTKRDGRSGWEWVLFAVNAPLVFWEGPGFPTIADATVRTEDDVKQIPHVESAGEMLETLGKGVASVASSGITALAIGAAVVVGVLVLIKR
jgi:hypothetical protein